MEVLEAYEERRRYKREKSVLVGTVNNKLVYIEDISKGGARLLSTEKIGNISDMIKLDTHILSSQSFDKHVIINSRIVWTKEVDGGYGYYTGIEFKEQTQAFNLDINHILELNDFLMSLRNRFIGD